MAPIALSLVEAFNAIGLAFGNLHPTLGVFHASQNLIQAVPPRSSPLLQLPYVNDEVVKSIEGENSKEHLSVQNFMNLEDSQRRALTVDAGLLSEQQYATAISVAKQLPVLEVSRAFFKVAGEKVVTPSSLVQLVLKGRFVPPGSANVPEVAEADLEDVDPDENDIDAFLGRKPADTNSKDSAKDAKNQKSLPEAIQPPLAYAPYFARDYSPRWHIFLADAKQGKLAVPPFIFATFDKPIFDETGKPTFNMQTLRMQFQAPPQVGDFPFTLFMLCDSYLGFDTKFDITLRVEDAAKAVAFGEDDISEPDEGMLTLFYST